MLIFIYIFTNRKNLIGMALRGVSVTNCRSVFVTVVLLFIVKLSFCQETPWFKEKEKFIESCCHLEIFGGITLPGMKYSDPALSSLNKELFVLPDFGASFRYQKIKPFSFGARISYSGMGVSYSDISGFYSQGSAAIGYTLKINYLIISSPFEYQVDIIKSKRGGNPKTFFYFTPYISTPLSASAESSNTSLNLKPGKDIKNFDCGAEVGFGFRIPTFSLEDRSNLILRFSLLQGFIDSYPNATNKVFNQKFLVVDGTRYNSAAKVTLCVEIPLKPQKVISYTAGGDGKKNYKKVVNIKD